MQAPPKAVASLPAPTTDSDATETCPYRGLAAFREPDADIFFGREAFTVRLLDAVRSRPLVALVGPSGSGKSSVLYAGLLPALAGEGDWVVAAFRPGEDAFQAVAAALLPVLDPTLSTAGRLLETPKLAEVLRQGRIGEVIDQVIAVQQGHPVLLLGDQFEELFTSCPDADVRQSFLDSVLGIVSSSAANRERPLTLLVALRADFYGQALQHRTLADALQDTAILLGPMTRDELRRAVEEPARARGVIFEAGLVDRILDEVEHEPAYLPLLEFTLTLLWEHQTSGRLTHGSYEELGGVEGALARHADGVLNDLAEPEPERVRRVFVQLVKPGEATADTRRLANRSELDPADWTLVQRLADKRLVVTDRDPGGRETAEVVHEALIQRWPRLRSWMDEDRGFRIWQERLRDAMRAWQASNRDSGALLRGALLAEAERWLQQRPGGLSPTEQNFVHTSRAFERRKLVRALVILSMVMLFVVGLAVYAYVAKSVAERARALASSRDLAVQSERIVERQPDLAILLGLQSLRVAGGDTDSELAPV